ncbi:uncharacterized protein [Rutidosis leptorrhynchoides]|uniref:uncharacterized protein n=1 Tax=Rutidosis leptorrhynchoides TaxID=125765 RepID=UPI003A99EE31
MAADQWRKRPNGADIANASSWDQYRSNKKKLKPSESDLKSHISLEWNGLQKKVVAKREQIAVSWRNMRPLIEHIPHSNNILADVLSIPPEVFQLENLTEVVSYEAWQALLSDKERNYLMQFLPKGQDAEQVVSSLLSGENFHFGSPFLECLCVAGFDIMFTNLASKYRIFLASVILSDWLSSSVCFIWNLLRGVSLCSGDLHPDTVRQHEQGLKAEKNEYYSEIQNYHHGMIEYLQKLRERWEGSQGSEQGILQKGWSKQRKETVKRVSRHAKKSEVHEMEQDITATSESSSCMVDGKACSSDNQDSPMLKGGSSEKRPRDNGSMRRKGRKHQTNTDNELQKPKRVAKVQRSSVSYNDGSIYMSYIKVTKSQYECVKIMKQSGKNIQLRSLNRVLGDPDLLHVQPYEIFLKEEQKKLHDHWLLLANEDLPVAYANWRSRQAQRKEMTKSLQQDIKDQSNHIESETEKENLDSSMPQDYHRESETHYSNSSIGDAENEEEEESPDNNMLLQDHKYDNETESECDGEDNVDVWREGDTTEDLTQTKSESVLANDDEEKHTHDEDDEKCIENEIEIEKENPENILLHYPSGSATNYGPPQIQSLEQTASQEFNTMGGMVLLDKNHVNSKSECFSSRSLNPADVCVSHEAPHSSGLWPSPYHVNTASHAYTSASGSSHGAGEKQCNNPLIDLETEFHQEPGENLISRQTTIDTSFNPYTNRDRGELLQSFFKNQQVLSYNHDQKRQDLDFQPPNNVVHYPGNFHEPSVAAMECDQKRQSDIFMPQNMIDNIYSDEGRFFMPRQEHFPSSNHLPEWNTSNHVQMSSSSSSSLQQSHLNNGGELNWFPGGEHHQLRAGGGWNVPNIVNVPSPIINSVDQSLFSVLSQSRPVGGGGPYHDSIGRSEHQFVPTRNYGGMMMMGGAGMGPTQPSSNNPLDYFDPPTSSLMPPDEMEWAANLQHQNPAMHDQLGKPYSRSWNQ